MASIGEIFAEARRAKGITLKDVEKSIKIRAKYVAAIEENDFKVIPGQAYVVGFINTYANYLGLDGKDLISQYYQEFQPETQKMIYNLANPDDEPRDFSGVRRKVAIVIIIILLIGAVLIIKGRAGTSEQVNYKHSNQSTQKN